MKVGFIGLGHMGSGMAANLIEAGHEVTVYNRTREKTQPLRERGAKVADRLADACRGGVVFTMVSNDAAAEDVTFGEEGILAHLAEGAVHISSSTISVATSQRLAVAHAEAGQGYVAAPVLGRPDIAKAGKLFVVAAGSQEAIEIASPLLDAIGQRTLVVSDQPQVANLVKLSVNFLIASMIESVGEAMALADKGGMERHAYLDLLTSTLFTAPIYKNYGALIADRDFDPAGFPAALGSKDIGLVLDAGGDLCVPMPLASLLHDRFLTLLAHDGDELDWAAIGYLPAKDAGMVDE